jgi:biopolymer transport protein ExbB
MPGATLEFLHQGGLALMSLMLAASVLLWTLIVERYGYLRFQLPQRLRAIQADWDARRDHRSWRAHRIREGLLAEIAAELRSHLLLIRALTTLLPMLGLLGTVLGMISVFEGMAAASANLRGLADGISQALLTTLFGLVTALPGVYFSVELSYRAELELQRAADCLGFR